MMLSGRLLLVMGLYDRSRLLFELVQLLDAMGKAKMHARACSGSGAGALLLSLEGVRAEAEV